MMSFVTTDILGKRKSARELYKEEIKKRGTNTTYADIELVRERVREKLKRNKAQERILKAIGILSLLILVSGSVWVVRSVNFQIKSGPKYNDNSKLYKSVIYQQPNGLDIKVEYFKHGPTASETSLKNGLKHQNSESYYETGEQFRSALYFYDTLSSSFISSKRVTQSVIFQSSRTTNYTEYH